LEKIRVYYQANDIQDAEELIQLLEKYGFKDKAAIGWGILGKWEKAFSIAKNNALVMSEIANRALDYAKKAMKDMRKQVAEDIARNLDDYGQNQSAATVWKLLGEKFNEVKSLIAASDFDSAEKEMKRLQENEKLEMYKMTPMQKLVH
jgi:hypothetical protein